GPETTVISRSDRKSMIVIGLSAGRQLLPSSSSPTLLAGSAQAPRKYVPGATSAGIVTVVVALELSPASRPGSLRLPSRRSVAGSIVECAERKSPTEKAPAGAGPWFRTAVLM